eukprot:TRINITY_DN48433_c0_g1_i1.p1 TRINITY_DN48433_c0_g1~~TRINITY_DN48433_c0_g1_i1.p1  ORF type:complete len:268 (-),score=72.36 TRINITY_DN48433_c0_g1_i1:123-926(-)
MIAVGFGEKKSNAPSTGSPSEDGDCMSSVSAHDNRRLTTTSDRASVIGLKTTLLQQAREERERRLADRRHSGELRSVLHASTQTDPVSLGTADRRPSLRATSFGDASAMSWSKEDEEAQAEALRNIELLRQRGSRAGISDDKKIELESTVMFQKKNNEDLTGQVAFERSRKEAAQQQVLCLEYELDGKEAALQILERQLEKREAELQQAMLALDGIAQGGGHAGGEPQVRALRAQLSEKDRQLELKEQHIAQLLSVLRQHEDSMSHR